MASQLHHRSRLLLSSCHAPSRQHRRPRLHRVSICCTAQPRPNTTATTTTTTTTTTSNPADNQQPGLSSSSTTSSFVSGSTTATAVVVSTAAGPAPIASLSDAIAAGGPLQVEQLATELVVVSAASSSEAHPADAAAGGPVDPSSGSQQQSPAVSPLPEGLPSPGTVDASLHSSLISFSSVDDDMVPAEAAAAQEAAKARAAIRRSNRSPVGAPGDFWWPPVEFSALVGLCVAVMISGLSNMFLCKPVMLSHCLVRQRQGKHKVMKECGSCCASPGAQANHLVLMQRYPQRVLQPLPLPLRQHLELDQLPAPTYKVPSLVSLPGPVDEGLSASLVAAGEWMHSRVAYQLQQLASANVSTKVLALWMLALPFIMLAAAVYQQAAAVSFREAMYKVYALLMRVPGIGIAKENNTASYLVANLVFLAGVFSFAAVIGIVSDEIKTGIRNSRAGNYNMRLHGHIVLLNWNSGSTALLRHIASAYAEGGMFANGAPWPWNNRPPVVVLADRPKVEMDSLVHEMLKDRGLKLEVHTREGNPFKMSDLRKVAASKASTIIVLHPENTSSANAEAIKVSVAMSLTALGATGQQRVVVQGPSAGTSTVLSSLEATTRAAGGHSTIQAFELPDSQLTHRLVAQTASQPGILTCWLDLLALTNNSAEFYCAPIPSVLSGKPFQELRRAFLHAVLCGYRAPDGAVKLNPGEADVAPPGSSLILLGRGGAPHLMSTPGTTTLYDTAATAAAERLKKERTYKSKARHILITNWPVSGVPQLMESFSLFTPAGSQITFVLPEEAPATWPSRLGSCRFSFVTTDNPTSVKVLLDAGIKSVDAVVLGSGPVGNELEDDARILAAVLQVQDAVMASKRKDAPHLVAPIRRYATSKLASQFLSVLAAEQPPAAELGGWLTSMQPAAAAAAAAGAAAQGASMQQAHAVSTATHPAPPAASSSSSSTVASSSVVAPASSSSSTDGSSSSTSTSTSSSGGGSSTAATGSSGSAGAAGGGSGTSSSGSSTSSTGSGASAATAAAAAAASSSSKSSGGLLTNALKALGVLSDGPSSPADPLQRPKPPVMVEPEFLVPTDVTNALMTQVVSEPAYSDIMRSLMLCSEGGMELYLRNPASFNIPTGVPLSFAEVQEAVRLTRQTAIGYIRGSGGSPAATAANKELQRRQAVLGCSASHRVVFEAADRIVVIAQDYSV